MSLKNKDRRQLLESLLQLNHTVHPYVLFDNWLIFRRTYALGGKYNMLNMLYILGLWTYIGSRPSQRKKPECVCTPPPAHQHTGENKLIQTWNNTLC